MKARSLWQPWASAMMLGVKSNETRNFRTTHRGPLIIQSAKITVPQLIKKGEIDHEYAYATREILSRIKGREIEYPHGALLGIVRIVDCVRVEEIRDELPDLELMFGNYSDGRFAWVTNAWKAFRQPIPWQGAQGFFDVPDEVVHEALEGVRA